MIERKDFAYKHSIMVFSLDGDKLSFVNDNVVVKSKDDKIKMQVSCYNIFTIMIIGDATLTTSLIRKAASYHISIILATSTFKIYEIICNHNIGNYLLRKKQYEYSSMEIAKNIVSNKIINQIANLKRIREHSSEFKEVFNIMQSYLDSIHQAKDTNELMGMEGIVSKVYFKRMFNNVSWTGRLPRVKNDYINATLDIGYTILFNFINALLELFGFDVYIGVHHKQFYMRKSLVCDLVEPFRCIIDYQVRKSINLKQFKEEDFNYKNHQFILKWEKSIDYTKVFLESIIAYKEKIFIFIQKYYRFFMNKKSIPKFKMFLLEEV